MFSLIAVMVGGALGASLRYGVTHLVHSPISTLIVNIIGCFLMGAIITYTAIAVKHVISPQILLFLTVGLLGSFTTFSTFSADIFMLSNNTSYLASIGYALISVAGSIIAFFIGVSAMKLLQGSV